MADGVKKINEWLMKDGRVIGITRELDASKFDGGTLFISPATGSLKYNKVNAGTKTWEKFDPVNVFNELSIPGTLINDNAITKTKILDGAITSSKIDTGAVSTDKIINGAITNDKMAQNSVGITQIIDGAISENKLAVSSVTTDKIGIGAVTEEKIGHRTIIDQNIALDTITDSNMFPKTLTGRSIADKSITLGLMSDNSIGTINLCNNSVTADKIGNYQLKTRHLDDRQITGVKIGLGTMTDDNFSNNTINASRLTNYSITPLQLHDDAIVSRTIKDGEVGKTKLSMTVQTLIDDAIRVNSENQTATIGGNLHVNGNITSVGTITGSKVFNPVFADIAEAYIPTCTMEPGDAVCLNLDGGLRVEPLTELNQNRFLGFTSNQYAACYGCEEKELTSGQKVAVALTGRIPVKVEKHNCKKVDYIGGYLKIKNGKLVAFTNICDNQDSVGRIIDIINEDTLLIQV